MTGNAWTPDQIDALTRLYPDHRCEEVARTIGRSERACYGMAHQLGIRKSAEFLASRLAGRLDGVKGGRTRFAKGHATWNKGQKGLDLGGKATRFKAGNRPHTWRPIGHERRTEEGYLQRKMTDTGCTRRDYVPIHHLLWREAGRELPLGHCLIFLNGDKTDLRLDNLTCISRQENMRRNTVHNLPQELVELVRLRGVISRKINQQSAENPHGQ